MEKETCVRCGKETEYDISTPIEVRRWYVEGAGQMCEDCWYKLWPTRAGETSQPRRQGLQENNIHSDHPFYSH